MGKGFAVGPFDVDHDFGFKLHVIPIFAVPKPELNKWRTIAHGSHRNSGLFSLNDYIPPAQTKITYVTLKEIVRMFVSWTRCTCVCKGHERCILCCT